MPNNLANLSIYALDEFSRLEELQDLLEICLEELLNPSEKSTNRAVLLIAVYLPDSRLRLEELKITLERIHRMVAGQGLP